MLASVGPGGVVGEMAALRGQPRAFDVRCSPKSKVEGKGCLLLKMPASSLPVLQEESPIEFQYLHQLADSRDVQMQTLCWLKQAPLFAGAEMRFLVTLSQRMTSMVLQPGEVLMSEGEAGKEMYLIREGKLDVHVRDKVSPPKNQEDGFGHLIKTIGLGTMVGEIALIASGSGTRMATVVVPNAGPRVELLRLSRRDFEDILTEFPDERSRIDAIAAERLKESSQRKSFK